MSARGICCSSTSRAGRTARGRRASDAIQLQETALEEAPATVDLTIGGRPEAFTELVGLLDTYPLWCNIVTP